MREKRVFRFQAGRTSSIIYIIVLSSFKASSLSSLLAHEDALLHAASTRMEYRNLESPFMPLSCPFSLIASTKERLYRQAPRGWLPLSIFRKISIAISNYSSRNSIHMLRYVMRSNHWSTCETGNYRYILTWTQRVELYKLKRDALASNFVYKTRYIRISLQLSTGIIYIESSWSELYYASWYEKRRFKFLRRGIVLRDSSCLISLDLIHGFICLSFQKSFPSSSTLVAWDRRNAKCGLGIVRNTRGYGIAVAIRIWPPSVSATWKCRYSTYIYIYIYKGKHTQIILSMLESWILFIARGVDFLIEWI